MENIMNADWNIMVKYEYDKVVDTLRKGIVNLSFIKVKDGQVRNMRATLDMKLIPEDKRPTTTLETLNEKKETVRVYDLDVEGWRSFRVNSLQTFENA
tara:strand:- start:29 stop:322 length:294 start_codon:yes stop_codon:yes gene_type:complete